MRNPSHRKDSFNIETENMKFTEFIKCYEGLSADCYAKFNNSYNEEYEKYREMMTHKNFILNKFGDIYDVSDQFFLIYEISINLFFSNTGYYKMSVRKIRRHKNEGLF
jgi:hypothetical protein